MGVVRQLSSSVCSSRLALSLFAISLLFQGVVFLLHFWPFISRSSAFVELSPVHLSLRSTNSSIPRALSITSYVTSVPNPQSPNRNSNLTLNATTGRTRLSVVPLASTGSEELNFPLEIDMPEVVRRVLHNLTVPFSPINYPNFTLLISNENKCKHLEALHGSPVELLILIKSAPDHFIQRDTIRFTWGRDQCWGGRRVVHLFLLGTVATNNQTIIDRLSNEAAFHQDIIQQDFLDHYYNNTYKIMFGIDWAINFCSNASLLMFVDDDFFVYPRNIVAYMDGLSVGLLERLLSGYVWKSARPFRSTRYKSKWWISRKEYPNEEYPIYVAAGHFFVSMPMARELQIASRYTRYLRFDDVFLGILLRKLLRIPTHLSQIYAYVPVNLSSPKQLQTMFSSHQYAQPADVFAQWARLKGDTFCV